MSKDLGRGSEHCKVPETGVLFFTKVDGTKHSFDHQLVTGREILQAAGKTPVEDYLLNMMTAGGSRRVIELDEKVDLGSEGIEKFVAIPKKRTDGRGQISPPLTDEDGLFLDSTGKEWSASPWNGNLLLVVKKWPLPPGFTTTEADVGIVIPITYRAAQIDMFYFLPGLARSDGKSIPAVSAQNLNGVNFQQWSRHRTPTSAWRPALDDVGTHLAFMDACLRDELRR